MNGKIASMPAPVVRRLTKYLVFVRRLRVDGEAWVPSRAIAAALGLTSSTVRQDLSHLDFRGKSKRGYETGRLEKALLERLGGGGVTHVAIIGAGNLGRALALHAGFEREGFVVRAIFDSNPRLRGRRIGGIEVFGMRSLPRLVRERGIVIAVLAVPAAVAQQVADHLILAGIRGMLNLTIAHVSAPARVVVVDARIVSCLQELRCLMGLRR